MDNDMLVDICGYEFCASHEYLIKYDEGNVG